MRGCSPFMGAIPTPDRPRSDDARAAARSEHPEPRVTFAAVGPPSPQLYFETRERLEREALADALNNAREKFEATASAACGETDYHVLKFVETSPSAGRPIAYGATPEGPTGGEGAVGFDAIWINKLLDVYFVIDSECGGR